MTSMNTATVRIADAVQTMLQSRALRSHALSFLAGVIVCLAAVRNVSEPAMAPAEAVPAPVEVKAVEMAANASEPAKDPAAECVARVLYGVRDYGLSEDAKTAVVEVIQNRANDTAREFRTIESIEAACEQANQWQGYVSDGPYLREDYDLALRVLNDTSGARTIPEGCYFLVVKNGEVIARTEWDGGNEWRVS